jgi:transmembrane sensor
MGEMHLFPSTREQIAAEAAEWFMRLRRASAGANELQTFSEWLTRSPAHIEEYLAMSATWGMLDVPNEGELSTARLIADARAAGPENVLRLETLATPAGSDAESPRTRPRHRKRPLYLAGLALSAVLIALGWLAYVEWYQAPEFRTAVGEQRSIILSDGSVVILNTNSEVRVRWSAAERHIDLTRGEARFQVAKNPQRPFLVTTAIATVRAVGTVFNVRGDQSGTAVTVLDGRVEVSTVAVGPRRGLAPSPGRSSGARRPAEMALASVDLAAGQRAAVTARGIERDTGPTVEAVAGWTERRLIFRDQPLAAVISEFNRYHPEPLVVDDAQLAQLRISGVFEASDPESLLSYLQSFETVEVEKGTDGHLHLLRRISKMQAPK